MHKAARRMTTAVRRPQLKLQRTRWALKVAWMTVAAAISMAFLSNKKGTGLTNAQTVLLRLSRRSAKRRPMTIFSELQL
jgi:hypothetical protein